MFLKIINDLEDFVLYNIYFLRFNKWFLKCPEGNALKGAQEKRQHVMEVIKIERVSTISEAWGVE